MTVRHLYMHIPFCHRICPYCAFYKHQPGTTDMGRFVRALVRETQFRGTTVDLRPITVYGGGGTPTLLSRKHLAALLEGLHAAVDLSRVAEWTMEANPKTFDAAKARLLHEGGVSRMSLGIQAWDPGHLRLLGRDHTPEEGAASFHTLRQAGFDNINVDLMFSLPGQSMAGWEASLQHTLALQPDHISAYNLTFEEDTEFFLRKERGEFSTDMETDADHFYRADRILTDAGFEHYEISNYTRPGKSSRHNRAYWQGASYIGIGPGAVSTVGPQRWRNVADTEAYIAAMESDPASATTDEETLGESEFHNERVALLLRTTEGLPAGTLDPSLQNRAGELAQEGVLALEDGHYRLTRDHRALVDPVATELML